MLDSDDEPMLASFISKEWIGKNRLVPKPEDIPDDLANYFVAIKEVPDDVKERYYPGKHETVHEFLQILLPRGTYTLPTTHLNTWFNKDSANERDIPNILNNRTLPPQNIVSQLHANICQAVLDGQQSVTDPVYPNSRLPLWIVSFWKYMWETIGIQDLWRKAEKWLESEIKTANGKGKEMCFEAQRLLRVLRWSEETEVAGANQDRTHLFAAYLSNNTMMSTGHINMMFSHLSDRAETDDTIDTMVAIETLRFPMLLEKAKSANALKTKPSKFMTRLEKRVMDEELKHLIFPAYTEKQKHWIVVKVDFERKELSYGK
jgi:hypothetical protein